MLDTPYSGVLWRVLATHSIRQFPLPVRHRVPSRFNWTLMLYTPCSGVVWRVLATHSIRQFFLYFPSRTSPCAITLQLDSNAGYTMFRGSVKGTATHSIRQFSLHFPSRASPCAITFHLDSSAGYTMFRGSVKGAGYPLHSPVSPSLLLPCVTVCLHISIGLYVCCSSTNVLAQSGLGCLPTTLKVHWRFVIQPLQIDVNKRSLSFLERWWRGVRCCGTLRFVDWKIATFRGVWCLDVRGEAVYWETRCNVPEDPGPTVWISISIYLLTAIGLSPGGSTHLHTNNT